MAARDAELSPRALLIKKRITASAA